jgi:hypothetical protein
MGGWESGASDGCSVMEQRGMALGSEPLPSHMIRRASVQTAAWSWGPSAWADEARTGVRGEGSRRHGGREPASPMARAPDALAARPPARASCADPYRAGTAGGDVAPGPCRAPPAHPLVERWRRGRATSDDQPGPTPAGRGPRHRGYAGEARASRGRPTTARRGHTPAAPRRDSQAPWGHTRSREADEA